MTKRILAALALVVTLAACDKPADVVSRNLSLDADNFRIMRRIVFYNGITNQYMLVIQGLCSLGNFDAARELTVTCMTGANEYKKDFLGLSDNVTYFVEQMEPAAEGDYRYKVMFAPSQILPDIQLKN